MLLKLNHNLLEEDNFEVVTYKSQEEIERFLFLYSPPERNILTFPKECIFVLLEEKLFSLRGREAVFYKVLGNNIMFWARTSFFDKV